MKLRYLLASASVLASAAGAQVGGSATPSDVPAGPVAGAPQNGGANARDDGSAATTSSLTPSDEIVVTATRRKEKLQNVPMSINVVTGADLKKLNIFDAKDVQQLAPGLELTNNTGRTNTATLRGISFDPDSGTSPAVDLYLNEIPVSAQTAFTAIYDIDQIEVLRGPQGTLRGRTSPAGAITIVTRKPDLNQTDGYVQATSTNRDAQNFQGGVSLPVIPDTLAIRAAVLVDHNRLNNLYNVTRDKRTRSNTESARLSVAWAPTDRLRIDLSYQYLNADNIQFAQVMGPGGQPSLYSPERSGPPATLRDRIAVEEGNARYQNNTNLLTGSASWRLGENTLTLIGGYQNSTLKQQQDLDPSNAVPGYAQEQVTTSPYIVKTGELRFESHRDSFWNYSLDAFYTKQTGTTRVSQPNDVFFGAGPSPFPYSFGLFLPIDVNVVVPVNSQTVSLAGSSRFDFTRKLRLEVAARYSWYKSINSTLISTSSTGFAAGGIPAFATPLTENILPENRVRKPKALTGSATLTYQITSDATAYVNYGRSFRPGSVSFLSIPVNNNLLLTKNETSNAVELGFKSSVLDHRLSFNADVFYQRFSNYIGRTQQGIYFVGNPDPTSGVRSTTVSQINFNGDATIKGVEASLSGRVTSDLDLGVSLSYVKARYKNALIPCNDYNGDGVPDTNGAPSVSGGGNVSLCPSSSRLSDVPNFSLTSNGEYRFHTGDLQPFVRYLYTHTPKVFSVQDNFLLPQRDQLNLYAGLRGPRDRWELTAFVKNVLNQQKLTSYGVNSFPTATGQSFQSGYANLTSTVPREIGGTLLFNF